MTDLLIAKENLDMPSPVSNTGGAPGYEPDFDGARGVGGQPPAPPAPPAPSSNEPSLSDLALRCAPELADLARTGGGKKPKKGEVLVAALKLARCVAEVLTEPATGGSAPPAPAAATGGPAGNTATRSAPAGSTQ